MIITLIVEGPCGTCCAVCHDRFGDTLELTVPDFDPCYCTGSPGGPSGKIQSFTGIVGVWPLTYDPMDQLWKATIGTAVTAKFLDDECLTPDVGPFDNDVNVEVSCGDNILIPSIFLTGSIVAGGVFFSTNGGYLNSVIPNEETACVAPVSLSDFIGYISAVSLATP